MSDQWYDDPVRVAAFLRSPEALQAIVEDGSILLSIADLLEASEWAESDA